ncbi:predicted protein [Aspergillus terreus NIH2624]|uniref:Fungal N-terminal domain-containing protein n=1 Tax=Aspergillus terreus (strain NIH 2624 / FGSC A1156) TaxID=341663 RepID=Q0CEJ6_ASPTN|nr:uncharacterized protein ATEG_07888 [Aspergillus terreus NIH2624]EAU32150.1 predicted protein [Aspergillus terreus NIH2624]
MYFWRSLSILLVAALAAAQSPSFDFETLQTLQSDQGDLCLGLAEQLSSLRVEYESFAPSVSGSSANSLKREYERLWDAGSQIQRICNEISRIQQKMENS